MDIASSTRVDPQQNALVQESLEGSDGISSLGWVLHEIRNALEESETHLANQLLAGEEDFSMLESSRDWLHQASGALIMLDLDGVTEFASHVAGLLRRAQDGDVEISADLVSTVGRSYNAICEYLQELADGADQQPLRLYPYLKSVLAIGGTSRNHPADLLGLNVDGGRKLSLQETALAPLSEQACMAARSEFEAGLLRLLRAPQDTDALNKMISAVDVACKVPGDIENRVFWHTVGAWFRGLVAHHITLDALGQRLLTSVNSQLRATLSGQTPDISQLQRDTIFCIACGNPENEELKAIFDAFGLYGLVPKSYDMPRYGMLDRRALNGGIESLGVMKRSWEAMLQQPGGVDAHIGELKHGLSQFQDATEALNEPGLSRMSGAWIGVIKTMGLENGPVSEALGVEVAVSLLFVEQLFLGGFRELDDLDARCSEMARRIDASLHDVEVSEEAPVWLRDLSASVQDRLTMGAFVAEIRASMREAESVIDTWSRDNSQTDGLTLAAEKFRQVSGVLRLFDHYAASDAALHVATMIQTLENSDGADSPPDCSLLADSIGMLGFFVDALTGPQERLKNYVFDAASGQFSYQPSESDDKVDLNRDGLIEDPSISDTAVPNEQAAPESDGVDAELLEIFLAEAEEVLAQLEQERVALLGHRSDQGVLSNIRRNFHTLKGSSRMVGLDAFGDTGRAMEDLLNHWIGTGRPASEELLKLIDDSAEYFCRWVAALQQGPGTGLDGEQLIVQADAIRLGDGQLAPPVRSELQVEIIASLDSASPEIPDSLNKIPADEFELNFEDFEVLESEGAHSESNDSSAAETGFSDLTASDSLSVQSGPNDGALSKALDSLDFESLDVDFPEPAHLLEDVTVRVAQADPDAPPATLEDELEAAFDAEQPPVEVIDTDEATVRVGDRTISSALFEVFNAEVDDIRAELVPDASDWRKNPARAASEPALRGLHSLKGSAALVQAEPGRTLADYLEQFLIAQSSTGRVASLAEVTEYGRLLQVMFASLKEFSRQRVPVEQPIEVEAARQLMVSWQNAPSALASDAVIPANATQAMSGAAAPVDIVDEFDAELLPLFIAEAEEYLPRIDENLRAWQAAPNNVELKQLLMRELHTVKGSARMAGAMILGQRVHEMETRVELAIASDQMPAGLIEELIADHDLVSDQFVTIRAQGISAPELQNSTKDSIATSSNVDSDQNSAVRSAVVSVVNPELRVGNETTLTRGTAPVSSLIRVRAEVIEKMVNEAGEVSITRSRLDNSVGELRSVLAELSESVNRLRSQLREVEIQADVKIQANGPSDQAVKGDFDPLEFDRYTRFQELTRMLAESVNDVATIQQNASRHLDDAGQDLSRQATSMRQLQYHLMSVRMVQFGSISDRLYRVVRQSAKVLEKRVSLDVSGSESEVDRNILETMVAPLEHLLRNAVSHGVESPQRRAEIGKPEKGEMHLDIRQDGNEIVLTLADDGAGLDYEKIRARGLQSSLIKEGEELTEPELANLIFKPGFSTATTVDQISGRGVGMDVVRAEVLGLGGRIEVSSEKDKGTRFTIHLPLTMAITQVMMASVGTSSFAVPAASVEKVLQMTPEELSAAYSERVIDWDNAQVPLYYLASLVDLCDRNPVAQPFAPVMVLRSGGRRIAVHADAVGKAQEVVVKNAGPQVARVEGVAGATVMGNGEVVLIVNPGQLAENVSDTVQDAAMQAGMVARLSDAPAVVMVVDDSVTVRKVTQRLLAREGFEVLLAKDGVDALRQLQEHKPAIMLVDVEMPRMDGFDLTRSLRRDERYQDIPIVMITSRTADKHKNFALSLGVNEFLGKPYIESELVALIRSYVDKSADNETQTRH